MPVSATAAEIAPVDSRAASYCTCSRPPTTSAESDSRPPRCFKPALDERHFLMAVHALDAKRRLGMHLTRRTRDTRLGARHRSAREARRAFLRVLASLRQQPDDVVVVEAVEDHAAVAARANEPEAAKETELMGDGRFRQARSVARSHTQSSAAASALSSRTRVGIAQAP